MKEYALHVQFYDWCRYKNLDDYLYGIEHGEVRDPRVGAKLKRRGVKRGVPDFLFMRTNSEQSCLWIEFKVGKNKQTKEQKVFEERCRSCNHGYVCCYSLEEAIKIVEIWLNI